MTKLVVYVDMDAFYVSVELRDRPDLKGRAVIVGPDPKRGATRGVVLSASYEARPAGVRSAMPVQQAARLAPDATWVAPDFEKYGRAAEQIRRVLERFSSPVSAHSIDEASLVIEAADAEAVRSVASGIQRALATELGLPASIGVAANRLVAKIASDAAKPAGIKVIAPGATESFLAPLAPGVIPGVGPKTQEILRSDGVETIGDLRDGASPRLRRRLGSFALELVALARGTLRADPAPEPDGPRSRSTDQTFNEDVGDLASLQAATREMAEGLADSLTRDGLRYHTVGVALRWEDFTRAQHSRTLGAAREGPEPLVMGALRLLGELWEKEQRGAQRRVRTLSVRAERLVPAQHRQVRLDSFVQPPPG